MDKRGVYFFVIDAFIGGVILLLSISIVLGSYFSTTPQSRHLTILEDFSAYTQNTQVRDFAGNYTRTLVEDRDISNPKRTLFEQVAVFHYNGETDIAEDFVQELVNKSMPSNFNVEYKFDDDLIYKRETFNREDASISLTTKKISMVSINRSKTYGPHVVEIGVWTS